MVITTKVRRGLMVTSLVSGALVTGACSESGPVPERVSETVEEALFQYDVDIRWTSYGIPHVKADDPGSLGYGFAYATARDAFCTIARDVVMVNGDLSRYFGPEGGHFESDVFHRAVLDQPMIAGYRADQSQRAADFQAGYVAGTTVI